MDRRAFKNFITKRSSIWTISLCMTGILVLGGIAAMDSARRTKDKEAQTQSELDQMAYLEDDSRDIEDRLFPVLDDRAEAPAADGAEADADVSADADGNDEAAQPGETAAVSADGNVTADLETPADVPADVPEAEEASSGSIISEEALVSAGVSFTDADSLLWPSAGTILIDYSMDGTVYFPTLDQYKYNPALIIGSEVGNQVLAAAKGIVESIGIDEETGTTLVLNIGNGYRLTYGQLKELAVSEGDLVEAGALLGYVSEPTKYYSTEGGNLYFKMTQGEEAVDPVLYLE